jgi:hypothetical protein
VSRGLAALAALTALLVVGCSADQKATRGDQPRLVLQPRDLPGTFTQFDAGKQVQADATGPERADPERFGRFGGWKTRYRRAGAERVGGPLLVESRADVFEGDGAERDVDAYRSDLQALAGPDGARTVDTPELGAETFALTRAQGSGRFRIRLFTIVWRQANVSASLSATGFDARFQLAQAVALARAQARRIDRVIG